MLVLGCAVGFVIAQFLLNGFSVQKMLEHRRQFVWDMTVTVGFTSCIIAGLWLPLAAAYVIGTVIVAGLLMSVGGVNAITLLIALLWPGSVSVFIREKL